jgi:hypothetical protein
MFSRIAEVHTDRTGDSPGFIDHIYVNPQDFGHFSADDAVAGIGSATGSPNHDIGDVSFRKIFGKSASGNGQKYYQTKN